MLWTTFEREELIGEHEIWFLMSICLALSVTRINDFTLR
jgi:hypothetical protein